uniref:Endoribonuclease n=1 Tax=Romanomermis culicivorax TaxID=13658 RepID=A0A915JL98_ROMCU
MNEKITVHQRERSGQMAPFLFANIYFTVIFIVGSNFVSSLKIREISVRNFQAIVASLWEADTSRQRLILNNQQSKLFPPKTLTKYQTKPTVEKLLEIFKIYDDEKAIDGLDQQLLDVKVKQFLYELVRTRVFTILRDKLKLYDVPSAENVDEFTKFIYDIWFKRYKRKSTGKMGSSAFQHVFIGESNEETNEVSGLHNWIRYSYLEEKGLIQYDPYKGYMREFVATISYKLNGKSKPFGSMFVGTSPEFEMAVFTLCYLFMPGDEKCRFLLSDCTQIKATTRPLQNSQFDTHKNPSSIEHVPLGTAYPVVGEVVKDCNFYEEMVPAPPVAVPAWGNRNTVDTLFG